MREPLADGDGVVERRASPGAGHAVGQQGGEENRNGVAELRGQLKGEESRRQGVRDSPREGRRPFKGKQSRPLIPLLNACGLYIIVTSY